MSGHDGNNYILMAKDGNTITKPRFQLIKVSGVGSPAPSNYVAKLAETIPGKWKGIVKEIIGEVGKNKVKIVFVVPGEKDYIDIIPKSYLRSRFNQSGI